MPNELREHQYEVGPIDGDGLVFGTEDTGYMTLSRPIHTSADVTSGDQQRPYEDGVMMTRDYRGGKTIAFELGVLTDEDNYGIDSDVETPLRINLDYLDALESLWTAERWRSDPNAYAMLRVCEGGRVSRAYGRPRRYDEAVGRLTDQGYTPVAMDFALVDSTWYSDDEGLVTARLRQPASSGLVAPLVAPLVTTPVTSVEAEIVIGGSKPTWPIIEFHGPVIDPIVAIGPMVVGITGSLAYDEVVTFDPRPWVRAVTRNTDGVSFAGLLHAATPTMRKAQVPPGRYTALYTGRDQSGTSYVRIRWRNARSRP